MIGMVLEKSMCSSCSMPNDNLNTATLPAVDRIKDKNASAKGDCFTMCHFVMISQHEYSQIIAPPNIMAFRLYLTNGAKMQLK